MAEDDATTDILDPARARALQVLLGQAPSLTTGDPLPPFFHQVYFWDPVPAERLGRDGHPSLGSGLIPDLGPARRMWAAGRMKWHHPLRLGIRAERHSTLEELTEKQGRTGPLTFARLRHDIRQRGVLALSEWQDIVYRGESDAAPPEPPRAPEGEEVSERRSFDEVALFRYSALTFNGHRIHYDTPFVTDEEGHPALIVHGPLLAGCLMLLAEKRLGPLAGFSYRATSALYLGEEAVFCARGRDFWIRGPDGRQNMLAQATAREG